MVDVLPQRIGSGRYTLSLSLGGGRQAQTFLAADMVVGGWVVVKRFDVNRAESWKSVELAEREARVLRHIQHPLLPRYLDHFEEAGALYTVMTHVPGVDLATQRRLGRRFGEDEVMALMRDAAESLDYLHGQLPPIIHRDLKPSNIIYGTDGRFRIVDFGAVAERLRGEGGSTVVGTFGYMAPEQFQGRAVPASDIYSLGATLMALLTGAEPDKLPHTGLAIDVQSALAGSVSAALVGVLKAMLEPNPERRPSRLEPLLLRLEPELPRERRDGLGGPHSERAQGLRTVLPVQIVQRWAAVSAALPFAILLTWTALGSGSMFEFSLLLLLLMGVGFTPRSAQRFGFERAAPWWFIWLPHLGFNGMLATIGLASTLWGWNSSVPEALVVGLTCLLCAVFLFLQWVRLVGGGRRRDED